MSPIRSITRRSVLGLVGSAAAVGSLAGPATARAALPSRPRPTRRRVARAADVRDWVEEQADFICSQQVSSGAVLAPDSTTITPYFVSWGLMGLARINDERARSTIGSYLEWYLAHLNSAEDDLYGLAGTVYVHDYDPETGAETSTGAYSSVDAGVATPVMLARDAWATGDSDLQAYVLDHIADWEMMIDIDVNPAPDGVAQDDGLCEVRPGGVLYSQDNEVVHAGMLALATLEDQLGRDEQAAGYRTAAERLRTALFARMWSEENQNWHWALSNAGNPSPSDPSEQLYPDAWCQYWPVYLDVVEPDSDHAVAAWQAFSDGVPRWMDLELGPDWNFPHTEMALAAVKMGQVEDAVTMLGNIRDHYDGDWSRNWYAGEAGHFIRAGLAAVGELDRVDR